VGGDGGGKAAKGGSSPPPPGPTTANIIYPVVGPARIGDTPAAGSPASTILAAKRAPVVAAEDGVVSFGKSTDAGCSLTLDGLSGATYVYGYLNNDLTTGNDNRGKCRAGTAYPKALKNGQLVRAGDPVGYVGDSGDADGGPAQLFFQVSAADGSTVVPADLLAGASRLLFAAPRRSSYALALTGTVGALGTQQVKLKISRVRVFPGGDAISNLKRTVELTIAGGAHFLQRVNGVLRTVDAGLLRSSTRKIEVWTRPGLSTLAAEKAAKGALRVSRVLVPPSTPAIVPAPGASLGVRAVSIAERFLGVPYLWAGADPISGFDCSGFVMYVYGQLGISMLHASSKQFREGHRIARANLKAGDLVFFEPGGSGAPPGLPGHVGMFVGGDRMIEAPHTGEVVKFSSLAQRAKALKYLGAVRPY
jgi:NlpC/P60 family